MNYLDFAFLAPFAGALFLAISVFLYARANANTSKGMAITGVALIMIGLLAPMWYMPGNATPPSNTTDYIPVTYIFEKDVQYYVFSDKTDQLLGVGTDFDNLFDQVMANAINGDSIYFKPGTYFTDDELVVNKSIRIYGDGYYSEIKANGAITSIFELTASYSRLESIEVDSNGYADIGVYIHGASRCELYRVEATDAVIDNFRIDNAGTQRTGNKLDRCIGAEAGRYNLYIGDEQTDNWVTGCTFKDSDYTGTDAGIACDASGQQFSNNHIWGNQYGYLLAPTTSIVRFQIIGDYIESNVLANIYNAGTCHSAYDGVITDNVFWSNSEAHGLVGINLDATGSYYSQRLLINNNVFEGQSYADTAVIFGDHARANTLIGNTFYTYTGANGAVYYNGGGGGGIYNIMNDNSGFVTENHGLAVLLNATTSIDVTHGLDYTPSRGDINVVLAEFIDSDGTEGKFYVSATTSTTFTVQLHHAPSEDVSFYWSVRRTRTFP